MYSVVLNDLIQFTLIVVAAVVIAWLAISQTTHDQILAAVPSGWDQLFPGWRLDYDWAGKGLPVLDARINAPVSAGGDGWALFGFFVGMLFLKGVAVSMAGPTPNYAIQHILSTRSPREAALENLVMCVASLLPRFLFIAGITVVGLVFFKSDLEHSMASVAAAKRTELVAQGAADSPALAVAIQKAQVKAAQREVESVLPKVIKEGSYIPVGFKGLILAGLLAAFMSTFVSTVNSGAAYVVNDVYRRYLDPQAPSRRLVVLGYAASVGVILLGIAFGFMTDHVHSVTKWIVSGLVPAFVVPNVLKWHWWRFNSWGFFAGMVSGTAASLVLPQLIPGLHDVTQFMSILGISTAISVLVCVATPADDVEVLKSFYRSVRPWGWWGPIYRRLQAEDSGLDKNRDFRRDVFNLAVSFVWQTAMVALPIYLVIQHWHKMFACLAVFAVTSVILKFTWYDRLGPGEMYLDRSP
jgi:solute:Na+ symporter, SSS family